MFQLRNTVSVTVGIWNYIVPVLWTHVCSSSNIFSYFLLQLDTNRDSGIDANNQDSATIHDKEEKGGNGSKNNKKSKKKKNKKKKNKNKEKNEKNQETTPKQDSPTTTTEEKQNNNNVANGVAAADVTAQQPESAGERS